MSVWCALPNQIYSKYGSAKVMCTASFRWVRTACVAIFHCGQEANWGQGLWLCPVSFPAPTQTMGQSRTSGNISWPELIWPEGALVPRDRRLEMGLGAKGCWPWMLGSLVPVTTCPAPLPTSLTWFQIITAGQGLAVHRVVGWISTFLTDLLLGLSSVSTLYDISSRKAGTLVL